MLEQLQTDWWRALFESAGTVPRNPRATHPGEVCEIISLTPQSVRPYGHAGLFRLNDGRSLLLTWSIADGRPECLSVDIRGSKEEFRDCASKETLASLGLTAGVWVVLKRYIHDQFRYFFDEEGRAKCLAQGIDPRNLEEFPRHDPRFVAIVRELLQSHPTRTELNVVPIVGKRYSIVRHDQIEQVVEPFEFNWVDVG